MRLVADVIQETMELKHTDSIAMADIQTALENSNLESIKAFKQQGGTLSTLNKGMSELLKLKRSIKTEINSNDTITRAMLEEFDDVLKELKQAANPRGLVVTPAVIGYKVRNIGSQSIPIIRMTATPDHTTSQTVLNPGQSMCLNRAEMTLLASKPEVGCTFANGKLVNSSKKIVKSRYEYLVAHYFSFERMQVNSEDTHRYSLTNPAASDGVNVNNPNIKIDVRKLESPDIINTYFTPVNPAQAAQQKAAQAQQTQKNLKQKGLFSGFKR